MELFTTSIALYFIILIRYFLVAGSVYWLVTNKKFKKLNEDTPSKYVIKGEIKWSIVSSLVFAIPGAYMLEAWKTGGTKIYNDPFQYGPLYLILSAIIYLFVHDTYFYWTHRVMHHPKLFPKFHQTHHNSRNPTPWAAFSFSPWEACVEALIIPAMTFFIPINIGVLIFVLTTMTIFGVTNHAGYEIFPLKWMRGSWGDHIITATHHNLHHQNYKVNFGLYFRFWDRLLKTDRMPLI